MDIIKDVSLTCAVKGNGKTSISHVDNPLDCIVKGIIAVQSVPEGMKVQFETAGVRGVEESGTGIAQAFKDPMKEGRDCVALGTKDGSYSFHCSSPSTQPKK